MEKEKMENLTMKYFKNQVFTAIGWLTTIENSLSEKEKKSAEKAKECFFWIMALLDGRPVEKGAEKSSNELIQCAEGLRTISARPGLLIVDMEAQDKACELLCVWAEEMRQERAAPLKKEEKSSDRKNITLNGAQYFFHLEKRKNSYFMVLTNKDGGVVDEEYFDECSMRMIWNDTGTAEKDKITAPLNKLLARMPKEQAMRFRQEWTDAVDEKLDALPGDMDMPLDREKVFAYLTGTK